MTLPALPRQTSRLLREPTIDDIRLLSQDIDALFTYLQRVKDQFVDTVQTVSVESTYSDENAQDAVGNILEDSSTLNFTYNDTIPEIRADVLDNTSVQQVEVAEDGMLIGTRKRLNFVGSITAADNPLNDQVDVTVTSTTGSRLVQQDTTLSLQDTYSIVVSRYFRVEGTFLLSGDATLEVL